MWTREKIQGVLQLIFHLILVLYIEYFKLDIAIMSVKLALRSVEKFPAVVFRIVVDS